MQKRRKLHFLLCGFLFFVFLLGFSSAALANEPLTSQNPSIQSEQKVVLQKTTYDQLKANNEKALNIIKASNLTLTEAQKSIVEQQTQLDRLKQDNTLQAKELAKAKQNSIEQQASLKKIEDSLNKSIEQMKRDKKKMQTLKAQRNLLAILAIVASGFAVAK